ncbi:hypothetical protein GCM10009111_17610 [Colwellia asteriadis]|uniref:Tyrosinase copper-binding domain-containing protein n=1 Tax=Colwellia asteriadis TaxID=517723 RepID=A0ABN1L6S2_9GAMM
MNKIVTISLSALVLGGLIAPKFVGGQLNDSLHEIVKTVNDVPGYTMSIKDIESNWFSTSAVLVVGITPGTFTQGSYVEMEELTLETEYSATHGPFRFGEHSGLGWVGWSAKVDGEALREALEWPLEQAFYQIESSMGLFGGHTYADTITAFSAKKSDEDISVTFSGYQGEGSYDGQGLEYSAIMRDFTLASGEVDVTLNDLTLDMLLETSIEEVLANGIYDSSTKMNFANIDVNIKDEAKKVTLSDLYMTVATVLEPKEQLMDMKLAYGVNNLAVDDFAAQDIALEFEMNNLSGEFIQAYQAESKAIASANGVADPTKLIEFLNNNLLLLVKANPEVNITSLRGTLPQGKFSSHFNTSLVNITSLPAQLADPSFWLTHALVDANINGDKAAIEWIATNMMQMQLAKDPGTAGMTEAEITDLANQQVPAMLSMFAQQGFLTATETNYNSTLTLKDKALILNDKPIPLPF